MLRTNGDFSSYEPLIALHVHIFNYLLTYLFHDAGPYLKSW